MACASVGVGEVEVRRLRLGGLSDNAGAARRRATLLRDENDYERRQVKGDHSYDGWLDCRP